MGLSENAFHIVDFFMAFNQTLSFFNIIVFYTIKGILDKASWFFDRYQLIPAKQLQRIQRFYVEGSRSD